MKPLMRYNHDMHNSKRIIPYILLSWWLWAISANLQAVEVDDLYEAELPVTSQGRAERSGIIRSALTEVLIKVSGNGQIALSPGIPEILSRSSQFLQQYRYRSATLPADPVTGLAPSQQYLWVRFDQISLDKTLRSIAVPIWGRSRPVTLAWLVVEQGNQRQLLGSGDDSSVTKAVIEQSKRRGIPLDLPLYDLEDQQRVRVTDISGGFQESILKASERYAADAVLVGHLRDIGNGRWEGRWTLHLGGRESNWSQQGNFDAVLGFGIDGATSSLASNFVRAPSNNPGELKVLVTDVFNLEDYARSDQFLAGLDGVMRIQPGQIDKDKILFNLKVRGDQQSLLQSIRLSNQSVLALIEQKPEQKIVPVIPQTTPGDATSTSAPDITFRLLK